MVSVWLLLIVVFVFFWAPFFFVCLYGGRFHMSMMEIYNEAVYDLLGTPEKDSRSPNGASRKGLDIRQNAAGGTSVPGLTEARALVFFFFLLFS